jgi:signal transduction histidine kinase
VSATLLAVYAWRRRSVPGAVPFVAGVVCAELWAVFSALELASTDLAAKIFWANVRSAVEPLTATVALWFAVEYADLRRWLVRRNSVLLAVPPFLWLLLALTNDFHHLLWSRFAFDGWVHPVRNAGGWILVAYTFALALAMTCALVWLFWRSPPHRVPVALCLCGNLVIRTAYVLRETSGAPSVPVDFVVLAFSFSGAMYAMALFRFRLFNIASIARGTVIDQMAEGMLVLDGERRIMDLNPAAERILGVRAARARSANLADVLPDCGVGEQAEVTLGTGGATRHYALHHSALRDRRGLRVGTLTLLDDVTGQKQAQAQLLEQQRALATLHERDRVARELHDTLGQVLGYIKMQAAVAQTLLDRDERVEAKHRMARLEAAAQDAQSDVREYILGTRTGGTGAAPLGPALGDYLRRFSENCGIATELDVSPELADRVFEPMAGAQLLRIIQEALSNVRKHARAHRVDVRIGIRDGRAEATVQDDGEGFDPALVQAGGGQRFGLHVMRERAEEVGGTVEVHSAPDQGTRVVISVPLR